MTLPVLLAVLGALAPQDSQVPFSQPQGVTEPSRLALTPTLDGVISPDEWDSFAKTADGETYMQWEPGKLYVAAKMPEGRDLLVSIDAKQDGWLVGKDNLEFRLRAVDGKVVVMARRLDATNVAGPKWIDLPGFALSSKGAVKSDGTNETLEAAIIDPGVDALNIEEGQRMMMRLDIVPQTSQQLEPFYPRVGTSVKMAMQRASALPVGLKWDIENGGRSVTPGNSTKIRFTFNAGTKDDPGIKKIDIKPLGEIADRATSIGIPFPAFDKKGRAFVDYETKTDKATPTGYHLLASTLTTADGAPAMIQASFRVAPLVDFDLANGEIRAKDAPQTIKIPFFIRSNSTRRLDGFCNVDAPEGWDILKGDDKSFIIYNSRAGIRRVITVTIPAKASGTFPLRFKGQIGNRSFEETQWLTVREN